MRRASLRVCTFPVAVCMSLGFAAIPIAAQRSDSVDAMSRGYAESYAETEESDSIVLERRSGCWIYSACPAYSVRLTRSGEVTAYTTYPGAPARSFSWTVPRDSVRFLLATAAIEGLTMLPDRISDVPAYCPSKAFDFDGAVVSFFGPHRSKRIDDYHGCIWGPGALREFEDLVDRVAGVAQHAPALLESPY